MRSTDAVSAIAGSIPFFRPEDVACVLRVTVPSVHRLIRDGKLRAVPGPLGRGKRITQREVRRFISTLA